MSKLVKEASAFFQKNQENTAKEFHKKEFAMDVFSVSLSEDEKEQIENLIVSKHRNFDNECSSGLASIKLLTGQIKSIQKQHVLLIGEKIYKVREILRSMNSPDTTFSSWINLVFHTKSSAYNALGYYELFISLPDKDAKSLFQSIPYKTAYLLASRKGSVKDKVRVLGKIGGMSNTSAMDILNKFLPSLRAAQTDRQTDFEEKNKELSEKLIEILKVVCSGLELSEYNKNLLQQLFERTLHTNSRC
ncbi:CT583 family protein (plasmid) [Chlamydia sp. 12-01]|uniref:CT583 family protein n=1 Tax=Chlamydia sp. 12-01 TaxID=3002742 RepID=UPI0035D3E197